MIDMSFAKRFADEWIAAWNAHDLGRILSHYADDFEMASPYIVERMGEPSGRLRGKETVGVYWKRALDAQPNLHFTLVGVLVGADGVTILYRRDTGHLVAEVLVFDAEGRVRSGSAHYAPWP
jgi:hypothetical protein